LQHALLSLPRHIRSACKNRNKGEGWVQAAWYTMHLHLSRSSVLLHTSLVYIRKQESKTPPIAMKNSGVIPDHV